MSVIVEVTCAALFAVALVMMITAYESNQWSQSDGGTVFSQANMKSSGLWEACATNADSGTETCATFDSFFLGLPLHLQAARAFTISALVLQSGATLLALLGISFCPCASSDDAIRNRVRLIGAACGAFGGASIITAVSWYASVTMQTYYDTMYISPDSERSAFGTAIFIGWASGATAVVGSLVAVCSSCATTRHREEYRAGPGQKIHLYKSSANQEYV